MACGSCLPNICEYSVVSVTHSMCISCLSFICSVTTCIFRHFLISKKPKQQNDGQQKLALWLHTDICLYMSCPPCIYSVSSSRVYTEIMAVWPSLTLGNLHQLVYVISRGFHSCNIMDGLKSKHCLLQWCKFISSSRHCSQLFSLDSLVICDFVIFLTQLDGSAREDVGKQ